MKYMCNLSLSKQSNMDSWVCKRIEELNRLNPKLMIKRGDTRNAIVAGLKKEVKGR